MDAPVIAALVTASGNLISKLLEVGGRHSRKDEEADQKAVDVVSNLYEDIKQKITDGSFEVVLMLESGENLAPFQILGKTRKLASLSRDTENMLLDEFKYRLEYLRLIGLLTMVGGSEYAITRLGSAFIEEARRRKDYYRTFYPA